MLPLGTSDWVGWGGGALSNLCHTRHLLLSPWVEVAGSALQNVHRMLHLEFHVRWSVGCNDGHQNYISLDVWGDDVQNPLHKLHLSNVALGGVWGQAREAFRLLEACHSCPRLQTVKVEVCDDSAPGEDETWEDVKGWETRIEVSLPRLTAMTVPWVFTELDLRGCSKLSSLVVAGEWRASSLQGPETQSGHVMRGMAARVTPPKANGSWGVEGVKGPWKPKPVPDVHWHSANTRCHAWAFGCCTVGTDDQLSKPQLVVKRFLTAMSRRENVPRVAGD